MKRIFTLLFLVLATVLVEAQSPKNITQRSVINFPGQSLSGCWHYEANGRSYGLIGAFNGIAIADVTNPDSAYLLFQLPGVSSNWHEVKTKGDYAYAVSEGLDSSGALNGLQIINLSYLPDSAPFKFYKGDGEIANMLERAHTVTVDGDYVYVNGHNIFNLGAGVLILDITDQWNPVYTGAITNNYCHDSYVRGDTIYTSDIYAGQFSVYDITDRSTPQLLAVQSTPGSFNHNTWLSDDGLTIYTTDEVQFAPVAAYDISDLTNITLLDTIYNGNFTNNESHNVRVLNDFIISPSYGSQLAIYDAERPSNLIEVGHFITGSGLCWDADPYLSSGDILATDNHNFYVFTPQYIRACYLEGTVTDSVTGNPLNNVSVEILSAAITETSDPQGEYRTGIADSGAYVVRYSLSGYTTRDTTINLQNGVLTLVDMMLAPLGSAVGEINSAAVNIFPVPSSDLVRIQTPVTVEEWEIMNLAGQLVRKGVAGGKTDFVISVEDLTPGYYSLMLSGTSGEKGAKKLLVSN